MKADVSDRERFWAKVDKTQNCWLWTSNKNLNGYGLFKLGSRNIAAHCLSWTLTNGPIRKGLHVLHSCDVRACVNPDHLSLGTHAENMRDMADKGRSGGPKRRGDCNGRAKLGESQVRVIRAMAAAGHSQKGLARIFGMGSTTIAAIIKKETWSHVL